jgi:hypothetical protein
MTFAALTFVGGVDRSDGEDARDPSPEAQMRHLYFMIFGAGVAVCMWWKQ